MVRAIFALLNGLLSFAGIVAKLISDRQLIEAGVAKANLEAINATRKRVSSARLAARHHKPDDPDILHDDGHRRD